MQTRLPLSFLARPFAHRGLHHAAAGVLENSLSACLAAVKADYAIEIDVQLSADNEAIVFHDADLNRLCGHPERVRDMSVADLAQIPLIGTDDVPMPLPEILQAVEGRVPVVVEIKDQDGAMGSAIGGLEQAVAQVVSAYSGPVAVMSFNPYSVAWFRDHAPQIFRGLVSYDWSAPHDAHIPCRQRQKMSTLADFEDLKADFISYGVNSLPSPDVARLRAAGIPALCWTVRDHVQAQFAYQYVDQVTFEGYEP